MNQVWLPSVELPKKKKFIIRDKELNFGIQSVDHLMRIFYLIKFWNKSAIYEKNWYRYEMSHNFHEPS